MPSTCCCVPGCNKRGGHTFPTDLNQRKAWIFAIKRGSDRYKVWEPNKHSVVCGSHFKDDDYCQETVFGTAPLHKRLKKGAVPSIFYWTVESSPNIQAREERVKSRDRKRKLFFTESKCIEEEESMCIPDIGNDVEIDSYDQSENQQTNECSEVKIPQTIGTQTPTYPMFCIEKFMTDSAGIHFYTGLETYSRFQLVLRSLGPAAYCLNYHGHQVLNLSVENQFFMTIMKLRRHTTNFELSRLFGISENTVTNIVLTWIRFIYLQWKEINIWPIRELVRYFTPADFRVKFPTTRLIIDGTECPIKKPKTPKAQQATFSTYRNRNTVKALIGASPGGLVSYISPVYAGSTSDRQIVERSNLTSICDPGDSLMADKGFTIQDLFATSDVAINIPTFFKKKNRMSGETVINDRKIASKRVHIERIIGLAKTYKILTEPMTSTETKLATEIIFICFMLCNFRPCIVSPNA
ncbi:hypothetical protein FSP39_003597 [Pinctada imbricata]|uniref:THAP-type domain-containing protein n=1 Tax=Pinctada imbricata TaxID=66713 RepID=A0AA88YTA3_PINIB|nr:hypothetical protein FSP39_003597 [Pinctada imbricata]